jgi:hypothetical protein
MLGESTRWSLAVDIPLLHLLPRPTDSTAICLLQQLTTVQTRITSTGSDADRSMYRPSQVMKTTNRVVAPAPGAVHQHVDGESLPGAPRSGAVVPRLHNLRAISTFLAKHLELVGDISPSALASNVLHDCAANEYSQYHHTLNANTRGRGAESGSFVRDALSCAAERNTRRRLYDALKIMLAVGICERSNNRLVWRGRSHILPPPRQSSSDASISEASVTLTPSLPRNSVSRNMFPHPLLESPLGPFYVASSPHRLLSSGDDSGASSDGLGVLDLSFYTSPTLESSLKLIDVGMLRSLRSTIGKKRATQNRLVKRLAACTALLRKYNSTHYAPSQKLLFPFLILVGAPFLIRQSSPKDEETDVMQLCLATSSLRAVYSELDILLALEHGRRE